MYSHRVSTTLLRHLNSNIPQNSTSNVLFLGHCRFYGKFGGYGKQISIWFGEQSAQVVRSCARQFEFIAAQRVRRGIQLFNLYSKIWDEVALKEFMKSWRRRIGRNTREFFISAVGVTVYNWNGERISDQELHSYSKEIEGIYKLRDATVVCEKCHLRLVVDTAQAGVKYCTCHSAKPTFASSTQTGTEWQPFIERKDMLVWRKEEPNSGGLYVYKVFGSFADVSAEDFLQVQVDVDYRKEWDPTAKRLEIIDSDPRSEAEMDRQSDVVYWEMEWPRLFSNRDYVYERRWAVDKDKGIVVIVNKVTNHPEAPTRPDTYRVTSYWSYMVIKPSTKFDEPGIEFGMTYFDDPGINIPSAVTTWVAMSGLPDFLCRMRQAAKDYKKYTSEKLGEVLAAEVSSVIEEKAKVDSGVEIILGVSDASEVNEETAKEKSRVESEIIGNPVERNDEYEDQEIESEEEIKEFDGDCGSMTEVKSQQEHGYLRYFFLTKLFA
ncbi:stAR-related lipid transfer protein 7, mitochondrial-like [Venturia canescens]|uniref:stAR-related lipid transfer protein 7, mitochondrial-like n=1 Tax=Venturia canescens TaxID=32260 RepID=UPI001C9CD062|nr:stAR-related lipid transfer protein 7, mitochondrial-like [Venturia canescens]